MALRTDTCGRRWRKLWRQGDLLAAIICLLPAALVFGIFNIYPILYSGYLSLLEWDGLSPNRTFVGLSNYIELARSGDFWNSLGVTLYYMAGVTGLGIASGLLVALALNRGIRALPLYRAVYFTPVITSTVAAAVVWKYLFDPGSGFVNVTLRSTGLPAPAWLASTVWAMPAIILVGVWKRLGFNMVIYLAGLQTIPREYYEAADVDGAGVWTRFRYITLPLLAPITLLLVIMSVIDSFLVFDQVFIMTGGGPLGTTDVIGLFLYRHAFRYFEMGTASAVGWVMFVAIFAITLVQWKLFGFGARG
ncbi:MAG TPA: sugar ABC transporter permease [Anaerolineae bacterium]|nr:sugar ABC transporter permease [Anaerolineae bacterium]HIQ04434.1 sugar ABC transporter permease [Anaerolineae bacterium]